MAGTPIHLGFIGLGNMGNPMTRRLLAAGSDVTVWNRTASKMKPLIALGAKAAVNPADVMRKADMVGLCLRDTDSVKAVALGRDGLVNGAQGTPGKLVVDFTSMDPDATAALSEQLFAEAGIGWIDAPVSGGVPAAEQGTLIIFAGGKAEEIARAQPFLEIISRRVTHMGPSGAGQYTKVCNQLIVGVNFLAIAETFALARRTGIDVARLTQALEGGFAYAALVTRCSPLSIAWYQTRRGSDGGHIGAYQTLRIAIEFLAKLRHEPGRTWPPMLDAEVKIFSYEDG
jgi:3-hydroxyisobutyrate dehydrogenase